MALSILNSITIAGLFVSFLAGKSSSTCPSGKVENYAFCCCKKIYITTPSSSYLSSTIATTVSPTSSVNVTASVTASVTATLSVTASVTATESLAASVTAIASVAAIDSTSIVPSPSSTIQLTTVIATPTPNFRGDGCFITDVKYGYYNECYCNQTSYKYKGFNNSNGYYTTDVNATKFDYKCWNLPKPKLYIGGLFDSGTDHGKKILHAADIAVEEINKNKTILQGYELVLLKKNTTKHWISTGSGVLLDYLNQEPKKVALLGPDDDDLAKTVAAISGLPRYKLLQISYGTSAIDLSTNHDSFYPYFFRTKPFLDLLYNQARVAMLKKYLWSNVGLIFSNTPYYIQLNENLRTQLQAASVPIGIEEEFVTDPYSSMEHLKRKDVHVILGSFSGSDASRVLCAAYKLKMYGPRYVYLFIGYTYLSGVDGCTLEQVRCAARYQFFFNHDPEKCPHNFTANFVKRLNDTYFNTSTNPTADSNQLDYGKYTYDAVHVIATALHAVDNDKGNSSKFYSNYVYGSDDYGLKLKDEVMKYDQCGASDRVRFDKDGNRYFKINIIQIKFGGGDLIIGSYDNRRAPASAVLDMSFVTWPGKGQPYREVQTVQEWRYISKALYIVYCIFAAFGIIFAIICLIVQIWRRKHKEIRYSFYLMNIIIIIGCILVYISVFLFGVDNIISPIVTVDRICRARLWVFSIGFALAVGGLLSKLWIAQDVLSKRILMKKRKRRIRMFAIVLLIFVVTLIILLCWHFINPLHRVIEYIRDEINYKCDTDIWPDNPFYLKITAVEQCKCANEIIWYFIIVIWKAFLIILAVYWAYQTREVFIVTVNDTQRCGICAYVIAGCSLVGLVVGLAARLLPDIFFGLLGLIIIACVTAVLIILFLHKILLVIACCRKRIVSKSATESDDDINCFSRCLSKCNCFSSMCGCCTRCCKGNCPKCFLCLAVCCAPCLACCAPILLCLSKLFGCCGSSCRNCCCGSKSQRSGTERAGEQKFVVRGIGDDKSAELARLQRELNMKEKYIQSLIKNDLPSVKPIWTQTTEPVILLSDTYDVSDSDAYELSGTDDGDESGKANKANGAAGGRKKRKRRKFKLKSHKLDFSHVQSRTDSNYKGGSSPGRGNGGLGRKSMDKGIGTGDHDGVIFIGTGTPNNNNDEAIAKLKKLLAERDEELKRLRRRKSKQNEFELQEIDESKEMKNGLPQKDKPSNVIHIAPPTADGKTTPRDVVISVAGGENPKEPHDKDKKPKPEDIDAECDALLKELDDAEAPRAGRYDGSPRGSYDGSKRGSFDGSNRGSFDETHRGSYDRDRNKFKIYSKKMDWSQIPSKLRAAGLIHHKNRSGSLNDKEKPPGKTNKVTPTNSFSDDQRSPRGSQQLDTTKPRNSNVKIFSEKIDYSKIKSKLAPTISNQSGSFRVLNGPADHGKLRATQSFSGTSLNTPDAARDKPASNVKILNDPRNYNHIKSKIASDTTPKASPAPSTVASPVSSTINSPVVSPRPASNVQIINDPKNYSHVKSKLIPDAPPKPTNPKPPDQSPSDKSSGSSVKILNSPQDYSKIKSKVGSDNSYEPKKSSVKIVNKGADYSHVKSKLL